MKFKRGADKPLDKNREIEKLNINGRYQGELFPSPSTLFNLACSDRPEGAFHFGKMANVIGGSSSGKSVFALSTFAEMANMEMFDDYDFVYDDAEGACAFNIEYMFGKKTAKRLTPPIVKGEPLYSDTIEDFQDKLMRYMDKKKEFLYVLDSFDSLSGMQEDTNVFAEKARFISKILRKVCGCLSETKSGLIIISQTRQNMDAFSFKKHSRSGGEALLFYATHEVWLAKRSVIKEKKKGLERPIGVNSSIKIEKNKLTGKLREVEAIPIYYDYGVDNIGSLVHFLCACKKWKASGGQKGVQKTIVNHWDDVPRNVKDTIAFIENNNLEQELIVKAANQWLDIENLLKLGRKRKYE